jgi:hypothetical protein
MRHPYLEREGAKPADDLGASGSGIDGGGGVAESAVCSCDRTAVSGCDEIRSLATMKSGLWLRRKCGLWLR